MAKKKSAQLDWLGRPIRANKRAFKAGTMPRAAKTTTKRSRNSKRKGS